MATELPELIELIDMFEFLDELRMSGVTNMYGAGPYLQKEFPVDRQESSAVVQAWMKTFDGETSAEMRATAAIDGQGV